MRHAPRNHTAVSPHLVVDAARRIDAAGFDSVWLPDAYKRGWLLPDGFTALAMAAAVAPRLEVGTAVTQVPLRPPLDEVLRPTTVVGGCPGGQWFRPAAASDDLFNGWMGSMRSATADQLCAGLGEWRAAAGDRRALVSTIPNALPNLGDVLNQLSEAGFDDALLFVDRHDDDELARLRSLVG